MAVANPGSTLIEIEALDVAYRQDRGWYRAVSQVSFAVARGEVFGLVGESGCGKSTVAYQLLGYRLPNSRVENGCVRFDGIDLLTLDRGQLDRLRGNRIALVPQNPTTALSPHMRVGDQIREVLLYHKRCASEADANRRAADLFEMVGLSKRDSALRRYPHQFSGGQQQRVMIAIALSCDPELLVLDEPTTGLDVTTQLQIILLLAELRRSLGMSMLYVTHDLALLAEIADRVGVMYAGRLVEVAPTARLYEGARHPYTRGLIASIPGLEASQHAERLRGMLNRSELPSGCPFYPRCPFAEAACAADPQVLESVAEPGHKVACRRWQELPPVRSERSGASWPVAVAVEGPPLVEIAGLTLGYPAGRSLKFPWRVVRREVVSEVSFQIRAGETLALVGESGSGKSSIARAISGLLPPLRGEIRFDGRVLAPHVRERSAELLRKIQYVFQNPDASLNPRRRVGRIIGRPIEVFAASNRAETQKRVLDSLDDVQLAADYTRRFPDQLSGGERQRVAIARALVCEPSLLLCDEVLSALDVSVQANVLDLLRQLRVEHDVAMLFISHDLAVVRAIADRVAVLFDGNLFEIGRATEVFSPPFHPYTHELLLAAPGQVRGKAAARRPAEGAVRRETGCAFAVRCPWKVGDICDREMPPWRRSGATLQFRCHRTAAELSALATLRAADSGVGLTLQAGGALSRQAIEGEDFQNPSLL